MVGRKAIISHEKILEKLLEFEIFQEDKILKTRTNKWSRISPVPKIYKDGRKGETLQDRWCGLMRDLIWDEKRLPCAFNFHKHSVNCYDAYIKIEGHCTDCNSIINAICEVEPRAGDPVVFKVIATDSRIYRYLI
ncbi:hypothetical protein TSAR_003547 [Trichomalopsis sarcophagae]|uniref:Uncharacterized protein n=1 Tax=Trichomalopsis sarcophagae TaxID=543379 RepID=A0A232EQF8_9HYME|nr:hypothetical protein TSAR_003547 [Trichomalopsis sarcophagae]